LFSIGHTRKNISGETADAVWLEKIPQEMLELLIGILVSDIIFGVEFDEDSFGMCWYTDIFAALAAVQSLA
jgi:hypothetical protein